MDKENYFIHRQAASDWINSKKKDFDEGLNILQKSGYKPHVASLIAKWGKEKTLAHQKLLHEMYGLISYAYDPSHPKHEDVIDEDVSKEKYEDKPIDDKELVEEYPSIIRAAIHEFNALYNQRSIQHKNLSEIGEKNDDASVKARKSSLTLIKALSEKMDRLWGKIDAYKANGTVPETLEEPEPEAPVQKKAENELPENVDGLKKLKITISHKITKRKNYLEYQQETKADKPNPLPEGAKREKYKKEIEKLTADIEAINMKIVKLS